jgi:hypothetical protein
MGSKTPIELALRLKWRFLNIGRFHHAIASLAYSYKAKSIRPISSLDPRKQNLSDVGRPIRLVDPSAKPIREII